MRRDVTYYSRIIIIAVTFIFCFPVFSQKKQDPLLKSALDAYSSQKWKSTATLLDLYLKDSTAYSENFKLAIISNLMINDTNGVGKAIGIINRTGISFDDVLKDVSREFIKQKMFDDYEIIIHKLINAYPSQKQYFYNNLIDYRKLLHQPCDVIRVINEAEESGIDPDLYIKTKAQNYILLDSLETASAIYDNILRKHPEDHDAILFFANYYFVKGKLVYEKVEKEYKEIDNPTTLDYADRRNKIGVLYREYFIKGIDWMEKAQEIKTNETIDKNLNFMYKIQKEYSSDESRKMPRKSKR